VRYGGDTGNSRLVGGHEPVSKRVLRFGTTLQHQDFVESMRKQYRIAENSTKSRRQSVQHKSAISVFLYKANTMSRLLKSLFVTMENSSLTYSAFCESSLRCCFWEHGLSKVFGFPDARAAPPRPPHRRRDPRDRRPACCCSWALHQNCSVILSGQMALAYFMAARAARVLPAGEWRTGRRFYFVLYSLYIAFAGGGPWSLDRALLKQN